jgi:hypothetical protein
MSTDGSSFIGIFGQSDTPKSDWSSWTGERERNAFSAYFRQQLQSSNWLGIWNTDYGKMELKQTGTTVTGTYGDDGNYTLTGTVSGNKLTGKYSEDGSVGLFEFYMTEDNSSFNGWFGDDQTAKQDWCTWNGQK